MADSDPNVLGLTCEQCDEMFQECINEVPADSPSGYAICQLLWDDCKKNCQGVSSLTPEDVDRIVRSKAELP
ncbi:hypothetical protein [Buttiauxella sp. 3AFRM03]|uniref:hypothetical protein n=1 Tax=Buttiauxella sp. 3AFRM03 TaxID=2479367 RepID=UPI00138FB5F6|nr:hypothetical protein [Buttiauxella sp. 3AFRM03]